MFSSSSCPVSFSSPTAGQRRSSSSTDGDIWLFMLVNKWSSELSQSWRGNDSRNKQTTKFLFSHHKSSIFVWENHGSRFGVLQNRPVLLLLLLCASVLPRTSWLQHSLKASLASNKVFVGPLNRVWTCGLMFWSESHAPFTQRLV